MNSKQRQKLKLLCQRFEVEFLEENYFPSFSCGEGWFEGWVGNVFFGVSPEGVSHS